VAPKLSSRASEMDLKELKSDTDCDFTSSIFGGNVISEWPSPCPFPDQNKI